MKSKEEDVMDRRTALRAFLGAAALATGGSLLLSREAVALPGATPLPGVTPTPAPAVATEEDVAAARVQNVWHWGRPHWRRVIIVRRRCWINRFGYRVCRW